MKKALTATEKEIYNLRQNEVLELRQLEQEETLLDRDLEMMIERMNAPQWNATSIDSVRKPTPMQVLNLRPLKSVFDAACERMKADCFQKCSNMMRISKHMERQADGG